MIFPRASAGVKLSGAEGGSAPSTRGSRPARKTTAAPRRISDEIRVCRVMSLKRLRLAQHLLPLVGDFRDLRFGCFSRVPRAALAFDDAQEHPRDDEAVVDLHRCRVRESRMAEIHGPARRILEHFVLP